MISKLLPTYTLTDKPGYSGKGGEIYQLGKFLYVSVQDGTQAVSFYEGMKGINPFRDLQYGGTTIGKYWFADDTLVGRVLKWIFI
jgi:hypothetical protein